MPRTWKLWLFPILLTVATPALAQEGWTGFDETGYRLVASEEGCFLSRGEQKPIPVPRDWLLPPDDVRLEEDLLGELTLSEWLPEVTAFPLGDGRTGLHLSSYEIQDGGSAQAAAGRDLLLVWDPAADPPLKHGFELRISRGRIRIGGCLHAYDHRLYVGDVDCDGRLDLGVREETIDCRSEGGRGPLFAHHHVGPLRWHLLTDSGWQAEESREGRLPCRGWRQLPLPGLEMGPIEFGLQSFESQPPFVPDSR